MNPGLSGWRFGQGVRVGGIHSRRGVPGRGGGGEVFAGN